MPNCVSCEMRANMNEHDYALHCQSKKHRRNVLEREDQAELRRERRRQQRDAILEGLGRLDVLNHWLSLLGRAEQDSITKAQKELRKVHINLFDLEEGNLKIHKSVAALAQYTKATRKIFPKGKALLALAPVSFLQCPRKIPSLH